MRRRLVLLAPLLLAVPISCQRSQLSSRSVSPGKSVSDSLTSRDPSRRSRGPYHVYTLRGKKGERLVIDMTSSAFDPYVALRDADGFLIGRDDDGGEGLSARLRIILPRSGAYRLVATSITEGARGWYTLTVSEWATPEAPAAGRAATVGIGDAKVGLLEPGDEQAGDWPFQDRWTFQAQQGQRLRLEMSSTDLDSYLTIEGPDGQTVAANDDGGSGRDALVTFTASAAGQYAALASSYGDLPGFGAYRLTLSEAPAAAGSRALAPIADGTTVQGRLEDGDSTSMRGLVDVYAYTPSRSGQVTIDLRSTDFDALLGLEDADGNELARDDDSGGERDSRLVYEVTAGRTYHLRVGSFGSDLRGGAYTLSIRTAVTPT